ncbi:TIGR03768 family metallophosphoesterase [Occallatibacter riparius]|uniref:TIGR03768 family metallophosphoesterase n=1 Tax=Occallatibacter riparius TaxID=1002689 RepID=A0A9J7BIW3_9BACT|nr:TIGR03768 family metallophosphoesterase [Occallatibacter riparius]UWZ82623.1 TIGR03768 family metallophosphoesterase [Occallatibacter riparius]
MRKTRGNRELSRRDFIKTVSVGLGAMPVVGVGIGTLLTGCGGEQSPAPTAWPIARPVLTTAQQQVLPVAVPATAGPIIPDDVPAYAEQGYSAWNMGGPLAHVPRHDLAPAYKGAPNQARLLYYYAMSDIHIADKESPAQPIFVGVNAGYGSGMLTAYSPILLSTTQVLDAAVQTINALHEETPFDFGLSLGDDANNSQYNELRWFIDVLDGKVITPSSGKHLGAWTIDYQKPYQAAGINPAIPWYQVVGNHDQYWMGSAMEDTKTRNAHIADTIINMGDDPKSHDSVNGEGYYMGVVDGSTPYGDIVGAGAVSEFKKPPAVAADQDRHTMSTEKSTTLGWMREFFNTSSQPVGHGFKQSNLDKDFACYSFVPKSDIPIKFIVLDDTVKGADQPDYAAGGLDDARYDWLVNELEAGQAANQLMVIAAHVPILPQTELTDTTPFPVWPGPVYTDDYVLTMLHKYPNLIMWMAGHRHLNVVTPQPDPSGDPTLGFWEVETCSLRDFPQQFRTFDIRRDQDNTVSIVISNVDPAVKAGSPAYKSRGYAIGAARVYAQYPRTDTTSHSYNAELVVQLTPVMQGIVAQAGTTLK